MGNGKYILIFLAVFFIAIQSIGQTARFQLSNSVFPKKPASQTLFLPTHKPSLVTTFSVRQNHTSFGSFVHYPAFFCQMELKSANRLGVMVKIHAGDYDAYHDKR